ncbi:HlyC/CorC family transporter [Candidatus Woesearchaeota archaeon]|jgi:putative hemolysin|nr:HlyC/CorC family transporter [Candidatus Woesearchaeota archaeon]MBT5272034.1 HlyC/CorC family transporter [Candidatus Woesearchaeota archaeon]MBT6040775.1 HlyC/CorC family transporter [Candidatus Woesearchaeota archaeon]MBT6336841.1 HlyC/CorC family transporter [Candidatus Woesearchaeota archaeon]MBT7927624.1 HlyC/CorC family transporter [Candidatus Woesearchaeota archaeon]
MAMGTDIFILVVLLVLSGFFSGAEVALISLTGFKVKHMVKHGKVASGFIKKLTDNPHRMLSTILIGNNVVNIGASAFATSLALSMFQSYAVAIATGVMTLLVLIFGEITPKSIAVNNNEKFSQLVAPPIWYMSIILTPILFVIEGFTKTFTKFVGIKAKKEQITEDEIINIVDTAEKQGSIKQIEKKLIKNIFKFDELDAVTIGTPKTDMVMIEEKTPVKDVVKLMLDKGHSRMPVYRKDNDHIVGIIHIKDVIMHMHGKEKATQIKKYMKKPFFVPEVIKVSQLLHQFQQRKGHMAVMVDEHGAISGLITLEDVLEEIVGEILDETDQTIPNIKKASVKNTWIVKGKAEIPQINKKIKMRIADSEYYDTISGFILHKLGRIPMVGDKLTHNSFKIKIEEKIGQRISKIRISK